MPVLYLIMSGLVAQLDRYRRTIEDFDRYLHERRQGLLFTENISDALNELHREVTTDAASARASLSQKPNSSWSAPTPAPKPQTPTRPVVKAKSTMANMTAFFTPTKKPSRAPSPSVPSTPIRTSSSLSSFPASPFTPHYKQTGAIDVQPYVAPPPQSGPWSPAPKTRSTMVFEEEDVFSSSSPATHAGVGDAVADVEIRAAARVTLSQLLDNVVILEESMKELAAIVQVRRSLGIDSLRYV